MSNYDITRIRSDFPILKREVNGKPLVYLDNGATTQKPKQVIDAIDHYYADMNSNVHRGVHYLSQISTDAFEVTRQKVKDFIHAAQLHEVIITSGTTHGINLIATCFGQAFIHEGDEIIISAMEHHSNIVPWQMLCDFKGAVLRVIPMDEHGELDQAAYANLFNERTKLVSFTYVSNALGTINPVKQMIATAHQHNVPVVLDAAQAVQHIKIDVQDLDVDFMVFSGHKMYGPTGVGVLYGKEALLNALPPYQGGGDMIKEVTFAKTTYNELPFKFEAGTPNIEAGICLAFAIDYINEIGVENIKAYEDELFDYAHSRLREIPNIRFIGTAEKRSSVISFLIEGTHPYDVGVILDKLGIAVRTGHHCAQPVMDQFGIPGTIRASLALYNTKEDIDALVSGLQRAANMLL
ncbi:aminotransferase class V-fold PLP-dependent enzyme [Sphingobacterium hungaricum]|uniref:Cysteine desulfurase n=1 Tax=Sphingobacterium hungaricum TaxID=2082723 RepID=A0A928V0P4_9SPHI|nr:cysteine desulfurase [Sphingobacterium hungaricum]MBE8714534.1 cysteine desulfurase CsdA [Sphingobacterium hungaricum]